MKAAMLGGFASGVLICLAFPGFSAFPLAWVGLIPYLHVCSSRSGGWKGLAVGHLIFSSVFFGGLLYWIPGVLVNFGGLPFSVGFLALVAMILLLAAVSGVFPLLSGWVSARSPAAAVWCAAGFWMFGEILRNELPFNGFPWGSLGYSQLSYAWIIQSADLGSVYLVSGLIVLVNAGILLTISQRRFRLLALSLFLFLAANLYGVYRLYFWEPSPAGEVEVAICQGNIGLKEDLEHYAVRYFKTLPALFDRAVEGGARWIIFPEAQNPYRYDTDFYFREFWESRTRRTGTHLLFNSTSTSEEGYFNSAVMLNPEGRLVYRYDKQHLVPFGEYLPLSFLFGGLPALVAEVSSFQAGAGGEIGKVDDMPFGTLICFEGIFPELARRAVDGGALALVQITNDGWFGPTAAAEQHLQIAAVRAIETRRHLLRAANTGYSAVVTPWGEIVGRTPLFEEAVLVRSFQPLTNTTVFLLLGFWPVYLVIMLSLAAATAVVFILPQAGGGPEP